jgi:hypothetical protein
VNLPLIGRIDPVLRITIGPAGGGVTGTGPSSRGSAVTIGWDERPERSCSSTLVGISSGIGTFALLENRSWRVGWPGVDFA